ncbi:Uncharacterised protein [uncultured archaeon]|nr:Uncharacterised protein [uncultured archaeon]
MESLWRQSNLNREARRRNIKIVNSSSKIPIASGGGLTNEDSFWLQVGHDATKEAVGRQEEAAKQLITITSLLQGIYFAAISFSDLKKALGAQNFIGSQLFALVALFAGPILIWLISLSFAICVLVPVKRLTILNSPDLIRKMYSEAIDYKSRNLHYAHLALLLGFVLLMVAIFVYLVWIQVPSSKGQ